MLSMIQRWCPKRSDFLSPGTLLKESPESETDRQKYGSDLVQYLSVRITVSHSDVLKTLEKIFHDIDFLAYPHRGSKTHKEHIHVIVPDVTLRKKLRERIRYAGFSGNETYSVIMMNNGICSGIQYCSKEGTVPWHRGDFDDAIRTSPAWVDKKIQSSIEQHVVPKRPAHRETSWQLNYSNCVVQGMAYARETGLTDKPFREVIQHMIAMTKWQLSKDVMHDGIPDHLCEIYEFKMGKRSMAQIDFKLLYPSNFFKRYDYSPP